MLIKEILVSAAYDKRDPNPEKNYGIHGVTLTFILKGEEGAVQFVIFTNWMLPHVQKEQDLKHSDHFFCHPMPADVGYHSPKPLYEGQEPMSTECQILGGKCYYDGSGLQAEDVFNIMVKGGDDALWEDLLIRYNETFKTSHKLLNGEDNVSEEAEQNEHTN